MDHRLEANRQAMNVRDAQYSLGNFDQEKQRNAIFSQVNSQLKEQLNLSIDELENLKLLLRRETEEKIRLRRDIEGKEAEWNEEKKVLRDFLSQQQSRLQLVRRAVTSFRRQYDAMTSELRHDVTAMNREMNNVVGRTSSFILSVAVSEQRSESSKAADERRLKEQHQLELMETKAQFGDQQIELKSRIVELTATVDRLKSQLKDSEDSLLDARTAQTAADLGLSKRDNEIERLKRTLEDLESADEGIRAIARGVLEDARLHGSASTELLRSRSPTRGNVDSSSGEHQHRENRFVSPSSPSSGRAPSTAAMVEAALQKRDRQLTDLEERSRREIATLAKDLHAAVNARNDLEDTVAKLTADLNNSVRRREMAEAEQTRAVASLEAANGSRLQLERSHRALGDEIGEAEAMRRRLEMMNGDLQRQRDDLETAKSELEKELERQKEENFRCLKQLDQNEQKITDQTKDLTQLRETVRRINADREADARHRLEFAESVSLTSAKLRDAETEMSGLRKEKDASIARLNSSIKELQQLNETLTNDKVKFGKVINKLEEENSRLAAEKNSLLATNSGIKDELIHLERTRIDSEAEYSTLLQRFQHSERQRSEATEGLNSSMRERNQLMDRLNAAIRDNQRLVQQLDSAGQGHRNQNEAIERLKRDKEALVCCRAELESRLASNERDIAHLSKTLEQARAVAGEEFEMRLETAQRRILELEATKRQMEGENEDLKDGRRQLQADVEKVQLELEREVEEAEKRAVLAEQCLQQSEAEFQKVLQRQKGVFEIDLDRLSKERDSQRREFESTCEQLKLLHEKESEDLRQKLRDEKENALKQLNAVKTEMEDNAVRAEAFRNQLMNKAESEKQELLAKLRQCEDDMKVQSKEMATARKEFQDEKERDRKTISDHQTELCRLRSNFENASLAHEMETIEARNQINEAHRCRELMMHDLTETKSQLKTTEDVREDLRRELGEWKRKLSNVEGEREELAKEANDLQLRMSQETTEKDLAQRSAAELRLQLTNMEEHRAELSRIADDFKQRLHQSEADREATEAERDGCRSHLETVERSLRDARSDGVQLQRYVEASQEEQRRRLDDADQETNRWKQAESDARHENNRLKKRVTDPTTALSQRRCIGPTYEFVAA